MLKLNITLRSLIFFCLVLSAGSTSLAVSADFSKTCERGIDLIVGTVPGTAFDIFARELAEEIQTATGINVVVMNKKGQSGAMGAQMALDNSKPCTAMVSSDSIVFIESVYKNLRFSAQRDFVPLLKAASFPMFLVVSAESKIQSLKEFVEIAGRGQLMFASPGLASRPHLVAEQLADRYKFDYTHVPGAGGAILNQMLMVNDVQFILTSQTNLPILLKDNPPKAQVIATNSPKHVTEKIPSFGFPSEAWIGIFAPTKSPLVFQTELTQVVLSILKKPILKEKMGLQGYEIDPFFGPALVEQINKANQDWKTFIQKRKIVAE